MPTDALPTAEEATPAPEPTARAGRALAWSFLNTAVARFGTLAIGIVIARLLGPQEFGTYAVAFVALMAVLSFNELGVSLAIVRWPDEPDEIAPTVNAISLAMSAILTLAMIVLAPAFTTAMGDPDATLPVQLLSLCVLVNGLVATPAALLQRTFRQGRRMVADQLNVWAGAIISVGLAAAGTGAMSLVAGRLVGTVVSAVALLVYSPLPFRIKVDRRFLRPLLAFGVPLAGSSIIVFCVGFVDQLVVGHLLGSFLLGYYVLAVNLSSWPVTLFSQPLRMVAPAMFSRLQHDPDRMRTTFLRVLRGVTMVALPACAALGVMSWALIRFVYGPVWLPAADVLSWLAAMAGVRILSELCYDYLVVLGRSRAIFRIQVLWLVVLVPVLWLLVDRHGIRGAAAALVVVAAAVSLPLYAVELRRSGIGPASLLRATWQPLLAAAATGGVTWLALDRLGDGFIGLVVAGVLSLGVCAVGLFVVRSDLAVFRGARG